MKNNKNTSLGGGAVIHARSGHIGGGGARGSQDHWYTLNCT